MLRAVAACCLILLAAPARATAQWHITPSLGMTFGGNTTFIDLDNATGDVHPAVGISGMWLSKGIFGVEGLATVTPGFFQNGDSRFIDSSRATAVMGNVVVTAPRKYTEYFLRPFVSGGVGLLRVTENDRGAALGASVFALEANLAGFNIGGGAIGFLSQNVGVRFELRYFSTLHETERPPLEANGKARLRYTVASAGLVFRF
jgi:hypothetical protein